MCVGVFLASAYFVRSESGIDCSRLAPLTVLAVIAAFLMALCFRQMAQHRERPQRWFLIMCLVIAAAALFTNFRYVRQYRGVCNSLEQMQRGK